MQHLIITNWAYGIATRIYTRVYKNMIWNFFSTDFDKSLRGYVCAGFEDRRGRGRETSMRRAFPVTSVVAFAHDSM